MTPTIYYCYDAYCGWCYGFSPVIKKVWEEYKDCLAFDVLSGGMIMPDHPTHIGATAGYIRDAYKTVEEYSGVQFGPDYLWHVFNPEESDWFPHSEKPAMAMCILKDKHPHLAVPFAADLQYSLHYEGRDLTDDEAYIHLLPKYNLNEAWFREQLHSTEYKEKAWYDFALCRQLQVSGYPTVLMQTDELKFYLLARGFTTYDDLKARIEKVLADLENNTHDQLESNS